MDSDFKGKAPSSEVYILNLSGWSCANLNDMNALSRSSSVLSPPSGGAGSSSSDDTLGSGNLHRKLQRQLTLNPTFDPRLYQMRAAVSSGLVPPPAVSLAEAVHGRAGSHENLQQHRALGRLASDSGLVAVAAGGGWGTLPGAHTEVTRIASAPDTTRQQRSLQQGATIQRLSSTSDTRLVQSFSLKHS